VIELTSSSTRKEDKETKFKLYRDVLQVSEYFMFDPFGDYLRPRFQGYRLVAGDYRRMRLTDGRLRSDKLGLILEPDGKELRLVNPETGIRLPTRREKWLAAQAALEQANAEADRLRRENAELRRKKNGV
jgi:hypothetical protein